MAPAAYFLASCSLRNIFPLAAYDYALGKSHVIFIVFFVVLFCFTFLE